MPGNYFEQPSSRPLSPAPPPTRFAGVDEANRPFYALHSSAIGAERINLPCPKTHYLTFSRKSRCPG